MRLYPQSFSNKKCDHPLEAVHTISNGLGKWVTRCGICMRTGQWCNSEYQAIHSFYEPIDREQQQEMSEIMAQYPTYEEGYKRGVEEATIPLPFYFEGSDEDIRRADEIPGYKSRSGLSTREQINLHLENTRKKLLTNKVTKWVAVFQGDELGLHPEGRFFETKDIADHHHQFCANYRGAFPVEIEVPL